MTNQDWNLFLKKYQKVIDYFGGIYPLSRFLGLKPSNLYCIKSEANFKNGKIVRKLSLKHVIRIEKEMKGIKRWDLRPDLYK